MNYDAPHTLYRIFASEELQYIGISNNAPRRFEQHRTGKPWFNASTHIRLEHFPDRASVLAAERRAIEREQPRYNIQHNGSVRLRVQIEVPVPLSPEDVIRNAAAFGMLACGGALALRWLADAFSAWWLRDRLSDQDATIEPPAPRNPFSESPPPAAVTLLQSFHKAYLAPDQLVPRPELALAN